jgi:hypothetical protein
MRAGSDDREKRVKGNTTNHAAVTIRNMDDLFLLSEVKQPKTAIFRASTKKLQRRAKCAMNDLSIIEFKG